MNSFLNQRFVRSLLLAVVGLMLLPPATCWAQQTSLPEGWQQMAPKDLITALRALYDQGKFDSFSAADLAAVQAHGKNLFLQIDVASTSLDYLTVDGLHFLARPLLDDAVNTRTRNALLTRQDDWTGKSYLEARSKFFLMQRLGIPEEVCVAEGRRWVEAGGTLAQVPKEELSKDLVRQVFSDIRTISGSFSVRWEGSVTVRETGAYKFFVSPININSQDPKLPVELSMSVSVAGQQILNATPDHWASESSAVQLTAEEPAAVVVDLSAQVHEIPPLTMHALLYYQGPNVAKSIIPTDRLRAAGTGGPGLKGTYSWVDLSGQPQTVVRTDWTIDFAWTKKTIQVASNSTASEQAAESFWQEISTEEYLNWLETSGPKVKRHPCFQEFWSAPAGINSAKRQAFLGKLLAHPALLSVLEPHDAIKLYQGFRYGTDDKALEVFGKWATDKADWENGISAEPDFQLGTRDPFRRMAVCVTQELPSEAARLQSDYLELPDGRCCLPVAYTLAYSYLGKGQLDQWIALLDARLADNAVTGDKRVNWLLARAHAEEIRYAPADPYNTPNSRPLDGRGYIVEGLLIADSAAAKARMSRELAVRLASTQQFAAAKDELQQTANSLPEADRASLTALQQSIDALEAAQVQAQADHATAAKNAYLNTLKQRRDKAAAAGDTEAANRYESLISAASQ